MLRKSNTKLCEVEGKEYHIPTLYQGHSTVTRDASDDTIYKNTDTKNFLLSIHIMSLYIAYNL
jgi:hypothetical protein